MLRLLKGFFSLSLGFFAYSSAFCAVPSINDTTISTDFLGNVYTWKLEAVTNFTGYAAEQFTDAVMYCNAPIGDLFVFIHSENSPATWGASCGIDPAYVCVDIYPNNNVASDYINPTAFPTENVLVGTAFLPTRFFEVTETVVLDILVPDGEGGTTSDCAEASFNAVRELRNESWKCTNVATP